MSRIAKLNVNDHLIEYDFDARPMLEALLIEKVTGMRYADWESELSKGSVTAIAGLIWLALRRDGQDVEYKQLISGEYEVDLTKFLRSMEEFATQLQGEQSEQPFPTVASPLTEPAGTATT